MNTNIGWILISGVNKTTVRKLLCFFSQNRGRMLHSHSFKRNIDNIMYQIGMRRRDAILGRDLNAKCSPWGQQRNTRETPRERMGEHRILEIMAVHSGATLIFVRGEQILHRYHSFYHKESRKHKLDSVRWGITQSS